ncbi:ATP-binding protein [Halovenus marina]|uniref:sensor histidine kinase n=1 Tax=Halovenus marina TaxID=3396621 RepID=UPI003F54F8E2
MTEPLPTVLLVSQTPDRDAYGETFDRVSMDLEVVSVSGRAGARRKLRERPVDCVVAEYEIPDQDGRTYMGGLRLLEHIRAEYGDLPVILFTEIVNEDSVRLATSAGVTAYIRDTDEEEAFEQLRYQVESAVSRRRAERRAEKQARINEIIRDVTESLVRERNRESLVDRMVSELTRNGIYSEAAFVAVTETGTAETVVSTYETLYSTELRETATESGEVVTRERDDGDVTRIAVPVRFEDTVYGTLILDTGPELAEMERAVLRELGETIGHALHAIETRNALERRERELSEKTERLEQFASLVSHDIRNPLTVAQGHVELLRRDHDLEGLERIDESIGRIQRIVDDILAITRGDELDIETVELETVVADAWDSVDTGDGQLETGTLPEMQADRSQLQRMLENLFRNAIEHGTPGGDTDVTVTVSVSDGCLVVEDDGRGLPQDLIENPFELGVSGKSESTGLGLSIVGDLADLHGWTVAVENDGGARFRIEGVTVQEYPESA